MLFLVSLFSIIGIEHPQMLKNNVSGFRLYRARMQVYLCTSAGRNYIVKQDVTLNDVTEHQMHTHDCNIIIHTMSVYVLWMYICMHVQNYRSHTNIYVYNMVSEMRFEPTPTYIRMYVELFFSSKEKAEVGKSVTEYGIMVTVHYFKG